MRPKERNFPIKKLRERLEQGERLATNFIECKTENSGREIRPRHQIRVLLFSHFEVAVMSSAEAQATLVQKGRRECRPLNKKPAEQGSHFFTVIDTAWCCFSRLPSAPHAYPHQLVWRCEPRFYISFEVKKGHPQPGSTTRQPLTAPWVSPCTRNRWSEKNTIRMGSEPNTAEAAKRDQLAEKLPDMNPCIPMAKVYCSSLNSNTEETRSRNRDR